MGTIKIHGGDFPTGTGSFYFGIFDLPSKTTFFGEKIDVEELESVLPASEETVKKFFGAAGMGLLGGIILGPIGALAGVLSGGRRKQVTFIATFKDGRKLLATTDNKTFLKIQAACL